jgi:hypothetical protein
MDNSNINQSETIKFLIKLDGRTHAIDENTAKFCLVKIVTNTGTEKTPFIYQTSYKQIVIRCVINLL